MRTSNTIKNYNKINKNYCITGIKKLSKERLQHLDINTPKTLSGLYKNCSNAKWNSYKNIITTYNPIKIIGLQGSSMAYSITLIAKNGDTLWITKDNNYLVTIT